MLNLWGRPGAKNCAGTSRRDFLKVGSLGLTGIGLSDLLRARSQAAAAGKSTKQTSVVWLWLGGGPTHIETFDPKMEAPVEYRSTVGAVDTAIPGVQYGAYYPELAKRADRLAIVRSFAHGNSGHSGGTHFVMTGTDFPPADQGFSQIKPSLGSIASRVRGTNHESGVPTYIRLSGIYGDGPAWLGTAYSPFELSGQARNNMNLSVGLDRLDDRRKLLKQFDRINRQVDQSGLMHGMDSFETQAFDLILGRAKEAFDLSHEDPRLCDRYKACGHRLGEQLLQARRLCEAGCGFVTLNYSNAPQGWDMHGGPSIADQMKQAAPPMDQAIATFLDDVQQRGLADQILLVVTGEFGRTPRVNGNAGRDHWGPLCTLALAGGGLRMGQVVGESSPKAEVPKTTPIRPANLMATVFNVLGIDRDLQMIDPAGRPTYLVPDGAKAIAELV